MASIKGEYLGPVEVAKPGGETVRLHAWMNPQTGTVFAVDNMELRANATGMPDPYNTANYILFADTFTGLPK